MARWRLFGINPDDHIKLLQEMAALQQEHIKLQKEHGETMKEIQALLTEKPAMKHARGFTYDTF